MEGGKQKLAEPLIESRDACVGLDTRIDRRGAQRWPLLILSPLLRDQLTGHQPIIYIYIYMPLSWPLGPVVDNHGTKLSSPSLLSHTKRPALEDAADNYRQVELEDVPEEITGFLEVA